MVVVVVNGIIHSVIDMGGFRIFVFVFVFVFFFLFFEEMAFGVGWTNYEAFFILQRRMCTYVICLLLKIYIF